MKIKILSTITAAMLFTASCTDLDETLYNQVLADDYGKSSSEIETIVGRAYASLRGFRDDISISYPTCEYVFFLDECVSDEACIPTRGTNWDDGGRYREAESHTWDSKNALFLSAWRYCYQGIARVNQVIYAVDQSTQSEAYKNKVKAELRGVRVFYYYRLLDMFGNVPIITDFLDQELPRNSSRAEVYAFVEKELKEILPDLPSAIIYGRFTQNVANTLLARLYLNSEVYIGTPRWQDCIDACDKVSGYILEPDYFTNFKTENEVSKEIIFAIPYDHKAGTTGNYLSSMSFHYNQKFAFSASGNWQWSANGISAQPGVYSSFDDKDVRKKSILIGPQINKATGNVITMADGNPLIYTEDITNFRDALENEGGRIMKYEVKEGESWERDHDWVLMRYSEVLLMKAECLVRLGTPALAQPLVAQVRSRAGLDTPETVDLELIDNEYLHEFIFEGLRRTTNIRMGDYFKAGWNKDVTLAYRAIFPIPITELEKNTNLVQNPGY